MATSVPDSTEGKVRQWALKRNGDPITNTDIVELVLAVDDDGNTRHQETIEAMCELKKRVDEIEDWRNKWVASCPQRDGHLALMKQFEDRHLTEYRHMTQEKMDAHVAGAKDQIIEELSDKHRITDGEDEDYTKIRQPRYTREQIVTIIIIFVSTIVANAGITYLIVHGLETAFK